MTKRECRRRFYCCSKTALVGILFGTLAFGPVSSGLAQDDKETVDAPAEVKQEQSNEEAGQNWPDATFSSVSSSVNRKGKPQQWQVAPDDELPDNFEAGDVIINVWSSQPGTLTPYVSRDSYATRIYRDVLEPLIWQDLDTLKYVPGLAKSWEVREDGMEITFHMFENACFSDGEPVTSADVIFTFDMVMNEKIDAPVTRSYLELKVGDWEAIDEYTVKFTMKETYFDALGLCGNMWVLPKHIYGDYAPEVYNTGIRELCIGSGPWIIDRWDKGEQIVLVRNDNYWGPKPALDKQVFRIIKGPLPKWQDFNSGKVDLIGPTEDQWTEFKDSEELKERGGRAISYYSPRGGYMYLGYNMRYPKFADKRTRKAMTMLLDRQEIIDTLKQGLGNVVTGPFYSQGDQYDHDIEQWPYDPEWAAELLEEAGWSDSDGDGILDQDFDGDGVPEKFEIVFLAPSNWPFAQRLQRYVLDHFAEAGIKVIIDAMEWSVFEDRLTERDFDMVTLAWTGSAESDPYQIWHSSQAENRGSNYVGFNNEECDQIIEEARATLDREKRMKLWHEVHRILHEEQPYTFLFNRPAMAFVDQRFQNVRMHKVRLYISEWYVSAGEHLRE